jgi:hypothetical protein
MYCTVLDNQFKFKQDYSDAFCNRSQIFPFVLIDS